MGGTPVARAPAMAEPLRMPEQASVAETPRSPRVLGALGADDWRDLAQLPAGHGLISMAVDYGVGGRSRGIGALRQEMKRLRRRPPEDERPGEWRDLLTASESALAAAIAASIGHGERSRAFFATLGEDQVIAVTSPVRLAEYCSVAGIPRLMELALAAPSSRIRGVIGVTRRGVTATEYWGPHPRAEWTIPLDAASGGRRHEGPARGGPRRSIVHGDLVARRRGHEVGKALDNAAEQLAEHATARNWIAAIVGGDMREVPRVLDPVEKAGVPTIAHGRHVDSATEQRAALDIVDRELAGRVRSRLESGEGDLICGAGAISRGIERREVSEVFIGVRPPVAGRAPERVGEAAGSEGDELVRLACASAVPVSPVVDAEDIGVGPGRLAATGPAGSRAHQRTTAGRP